MDKKEQVIEALQNFITEREASQKKRSVARRGEEESNTTVLDWTLTQLHIVAMIKERGSANNSELSSELNVSKPAITKAVRKLLQYNMIAKTQLERNKKEIHYVLTESGKRLALVHEQLHQKARNKYLSLLKKFSDTELDAITKFLNVVTGSLKDNEEQRGCD
ncbi:MarR family transcriptional regulator [Lysinibacillus agricola]|uniref:MarR family transcriptional regulator n=1 Tax=Lysinibacillus agricola TaxID=2590012 RepID=UPI003C1C4EA3